MPDIQSPIHRMSRGEGTPLPKVRILLAAPRGFCAGVSRAIQAVEEAIARFGAPVYVRRPIVHNLAVVRSLEAKGAIFVEELDQIPDGAVVLFSAHGVARSISDEADRRSLRWFDAICPLVTKVHREVVRHHENGRHLLLIGHEGHPEIAGTIGQLPPGSATIVRNPAQVRNLPLSPTLPVAYAIQTTYSQAEAAHIVDAIFDRFDDVHGPSGSDICYATTNRQAALGAIAGRVDAVIVAGASFSSNATRLAELARDAGCLSVQLIAEASEMDWSMLSGATKIGITAAASTPEATIADIIARLGDRFRLDIEEVEHRAETISFRPLGFA